MVIQGGSFKGKGGDLKPKEVVSLLLDDEEIEKRVKVKLEEEEEKVEKEKKEKSKAKKREGTPIKADAEKKPKLENDVNDEPNDVDVNSEESKPLYDFAGDKMGPKKGKGRGVGKRGRPKGGGGLKSVGRGGEGLKKGNNNHHEAENGHNILDEETVGLYSQT